MHLQLAIYFESKLFASRLYAAHCTQLYQVHQESSDMNLLSLLFNEPIEN